MSDRRIYLKPGLCLALVAGQKLSFSQLEGNTRRGTPVRLKIIDLLNGGFEGGAEELALAMRKSFNVPRRVVLQFLEQLDELGYLSETAPAPCFAGEPKHLLGEPGDEEVCIATPVSFVTQDGYYYLYSHDGEPLLKLTMAELRAVTLFSDGITAERALAQYLSLELPEKLTGEQFNELVGRLAGAGVLGEPKVVEDDAKKKVFFKVDREVLQSLVDTRVAAHEAKVAEEGRGRVQVVPVNTVHGTTPAALGLLVAYAMDYEGGRLQQRYDFVPMFLTDAARLAERAKRPGIFLFSNYLWNVEANLLLSAVVKQANPDNITIHGGPSTPSYEKDCEDFFADNPHVDIAVRGEGEQAFVDIIDKLRVEERAGLDVLEGVPGLSYRDASGVIRTGNRERIPDLDTIPSPYLNGLFDEFGEARAGAVIESNRGCPYGCTFCDWGSATLSKVRKFDLERVFAELEWSAKYHVDDASIADANFGMLPRDVDITQKIADLRRAYGYPNMVGINYAKNQVRYLRDIIRILAESGILTEGKVSLQSMDAGTLEAVDRSNIKLSKYNELSAEFRQAQLPLGVELMMGLPGSTMQSFRNDLQDCTNRDMRVVVNPTMILPNSPMNEPGYRETHGIIATAGEYVQETSTYSREDWDRMMQLRDAYYLFDTYGIARYLARYVRSETGTREIDFYEKLQSDILADPRRWPVLAGTLKTLADYMAPPGSWSFFISELKDYVVNQLGIPDNTGLRTALAVQLAHLPATDRAFPQVLELEHDFSAWWSAMLKTREDGHRDDWEKLVPPLAEFGPATMTIDDPNSICVTEVGKTLGALGLNLRTWELDSSVARTRSGVTTRVL